MWPIFGSQIGNVGWAGTAMHTSPTRLPVRQRAGQRLLPTIVLMFLGVSWCGARSEAADFSCAGGDVPCLVAAIHQANANGQANTIRLAAGVYTLTAVNNQADGPNGLPSVASTLTITGDAADVTSIARDAAAPFFRILHVALGAVLTLRGVTIRGGLLAWDFSSSGAGILALGSVNINDCVVTQNGTVNNGPGGGVAGGNVLVTRSTISANGADSGAGIYIRPNGNLTVKNSTITQNVAGGGGGGIWFQSPGTLTLADALISGNLSDVFGPIAGGSGVAVGDLSTIGGATMTITDSTISNNHRGGGIYIFAGNTVHISRSSIVGNGSGLGPGSGIALETHATLTIDDSTIANNVAFDNVSDLYLAGTTIVTNSTIVGSDANNITGNIFNQGSTSVENTILSSSSSRGPVDCPSKITSLGHNVIDGGMLSCVDRISSDLTGDPGLGDFVDPGRPGTAHFPLLASSPAIDAGDNAACGKTDQLGLFRPIDGNGDAVRACDIGATEFYPVVNDLVALDALHSKFIPPPARNTSIP